MGERRESEAVRLFRENLWILSAILSAVFVLAIGYLSRQFIEGISTVAFFLAALIFWAAALLHLLSGIYEPIRLMTHPDRSGNVINIQLEQLRNDYMKEIGVTVIDQALRANLESQQPLPLDDIPEDQTRRWVSIDPDLYSMDEETLAEVGTLVRSIDFIQKMRSVLRSARLSFRRGAAVLPLWWPIILAAGVLVAQLPQDPQTAWLAFFAPILPGIFIWTLVVPGQGAIARLRGQLNKLRHASYQEIKRRVQQMAAEEAE